MREASMLGYFDFSDILFALCNALCRAFQVTMAVEMTNSAIHYDKQTAVFSGDLPQPLLPGHCIEVIGAPLTECDRFDVNFLVSEGSNPDIAFHFNPRLLENYVVRNSRRNGKWETEDTTSHGRLVLPRNVSFCLWFFIAPTEFMVSINGQHFCVFPYRVPITRVRFLEIIGDVSICTVGVKEQTCYPSDDVNIRTPVPFNDIYTEGTSLPNPFIGHLSQGFQNGWQLEIHGKVNLLPNNFYINLQEGNALWPHPNIPLHLNPRFNTTMNCPTLIYNTWEDNSWGTEERSPGFHFVPSKPFRLVIQLDYNREIFIVWVNHKLEGEFRFRNFNTVEKIDTVYIQGDIVLYKVFMQKNFTSMILPSKRKGALLNFLIRPEH